MTSFFGKAVYTTGTTIQASDGMTGIVVGAPVTGPRIGTGGAVGMGRARISGFLFLLLVVIAIAGTLRAKGTTINYASNNMTLLIVTAPVTGRGFGTVVAISVTMTRRERKGGR